MSGVDFVIFVAAHDRAIADEIAALLDICAQSLKRIHPAAAINLLTDEATELHSAADLTTRLVVQPRIDMQELQLERVKAYRAFLSRPDFRCDTILLDFDMVANRSLAPIFERSFDIAVTFRPWTQRHPINGGFLALRHGRRQLIEGFFDRAIAHFEAMTTPDARRWGGDQDALRMALGPLSGPLAQGPIVTTHGETVMLLDTSTINYSIWDGYPPEALPNAMTADMFRDMAQRDLVHFKGKRKTYMASYWQALIGSPPSPAT